MRIGIIMHPYGELYPGGLPRIIEGWARSLVSTHPENEYLLFFKEEPKILPDFFGENCSVYVLGAGRLWLNRLRRMPRADVYLFNTPVLPFLWKPKSSVVIALDYPYKYLKAKNLKEKIWRVFIFLYHRYSLKRAEHIIAVSESTKCDTMKFFSIRGTKISVVYHGYTSVCAKPEERVTLPDLPYFFFAGTMKERKNVLNIVRAFSSFVKTNGNYILVLGGKSQGEYYERLLAEVRARGLDKSVVFTGHMNENQLSYLYKRAAALIFPSIVEGTGFPVLEALDCGIPVITSNIFGTAELGAGGAALLINPYKPEEITRAMERIVRETGLKDKLLEKSRERLKKFDWSKTGEETYKILKKLAIND